MDILQRLMRFLRSLRNRRLRDDEAAVILAPDMQMELCLPMRGDDEEMTPAHVVLAAAIGARLAVEDKRWLDELMKWFDQEVDEARKERLH